MLTAHNAAEHYFRVHGLLLRAASPFLDNILGSAHLHTLQVWKFICSLGLKGIPNSVYDLVAYPALITLMMRAKLATHSMSIYPTNLISNSLLIGVL